MTNRQMRKVPVLIKVVIGVICTIFILIAVIGSIHGQTMPRNVKGCIGTVDDWKTVQTSFSGPRIASVEWKSA
jgi:hypothetical protein